MELLRAEVADMATRLHSVDARLDFTEQLLGGDLLGSSAPEPLPPAGSSSAADDHDLPEPVGHSDLDDPLVSSDAEGDEGLLILSERLDAEREVEKRCEHYVELVKAGEDSPEALQSPEQPLDFIAAAIHDSVVMPLVNTVARGWHDGRKA